MFYTDENGKYRRPKELRVPPTVTERFKNNEYWNKRRLTYMGNQLFFDQELRTGICYFCKMEGRAQKSRRTSLHHVKYDNYDPLAWTIEVCNSCHWQIDPKNREVFARSTGKEINPRRQPYYENKEQRMERAERDKADWYKSHCWNIDGKFEPIMSLIPDRETFDKVVEAVKKATPKRNTMSDVSHRYF